MTPPAPLFASRLLWQLDQLKSHLLPIAREFRAFPSPIVEAPVPEILQPPFSEDKHVETPQAKLEVAPLDLLMCSNYIPRCWSVDNSTVRGNNTMNVQQPGKPVI